MFLTNTLSENLGIAGAALTAVLGYAVVFFGLILLMIVVIILGKSFTANKEQPTKKAEPVAAPVAPAAPAAPVATPVASAPQGDAAPGSAGKLKLHDVPPKTAAMLMAIVAHRLNKPLNELRFISIKEVK